MSDTWPSNTGEPLLGDDPVVDVEAAPPPSDASLQRVATLAREQVVRQRDVDRLKRELEAAVEALRVNMETDLPAAMLEVGMTSFGLTGGWSVEVDEAVTGSIPKDPVRTEEAHDWLEANRHFIVKRRITILFGREDEAWAAKFMRDCAARKKPLNLETKKWVEPQTLSAFVREQLREAKSRNVDPETLAPTGLLGVFKRTYARVKAPKEMPT